MSGVYEIVTNKIIEELEKGVVPWRKPWNAFGRAMNWVTKKEYRGINAFLLPPGEYASKKQILEAGGRIKYEEMKNSHIVVYWLWKEIEDEETEEIIKFAKPFYYRVWEINTQVTGLKPKRNVQLFDHNPIEEAERILKKYEDGPTITYNPREQAVYYPKLDRVNTPPIEHFKNPDEYYSTLFHELAHSTGHQKRLNREGITKTAGFGSELYSKEELVAELGAAMLCGVAGIDNSTIENSASYISSWLKKLKDDKKLIVQAAAQAQKAADLIQGLNYKEEGNKHKKDGVA